MPDRDDLSLRQRIIDVCLAMNACGLNAGKAGNVSARVEGGLLITPSGMAYTDLIAEDICFVDFDGRSDGPRAPSSEWRFHRDIYADRTEAGGIVHAHPEHCTSLACLNKPIPPFHYMVAVAGGFDIRCADYATFGTQALSDAIMRALAGRRACLMANHGMVAFGRDPETALDLAVEVEQLAAQYLGALRIGEPVLLDEDEMRRVLEKFETYGRQPDPQTHA